MCNPYRRRVCDKCLDIEGKFLLFCAVNFLCIILGVNSGLEQSASHSPLSSTPPPHQTAGYPGPPFSCHPSRPGRKHQ